METMSDKIKRLLGKSNRKEVGFTLVEVLIALAILSLIAVGIYSVLNSSLTSSVGQDERSTASNLAVAQMEYVKDLKIDWVEWGDPEEDPDWVPPEYYPSTSILDEYPGYEVTIDRESTDRGIFLQLITVTVSHDGEVACVLEGEKQISEDTFTGW